MPQASSPRRLRVSARSLTGLSGAFTYPLPHGRGSDRSPDRKGGVSRKSTILRGRGTSCTSLASVRECDTFPCIRYVKVGHGSSPPALVVERFDTREGLNDRRLIALEALCSVLDLPHDAKIQRHHRTRWPRAPRSFDSVRRRPPDVVKTRPVRLAHCGRRHAPEEFSAAEDRPSR